MHRPCSQIIRKTIKTSKILVLCFALGLFTGCASLSARHHRIKGEKAERRGDILKARQHYGRVIEAKPTSWRGWYRLGALALDESRAALARDCFIEAIAAEPEKALLWHQLGVAHWRLDENAEAVQAFRRGLEADPEYGPIHYALGLFFERRSEKEAALDSYLLAWEYGIRSPKLARRIQRLNTAF